MSLPGGGFALIVSKRNTYPDGKEFVGVGIQPDIVVETTIDDVRAGRDPVLERARGRSPILRVVVGGPAEPLNHSIFWNSEYRMASRRQEGLP